MIQFLVVFHMLPINTATAYSRTAHAADARVFLDIKSAKTLKLFLQRSQQDEDRIKMAVSSLSQEKRAQLAENLFFKSESHEKTMNSAIEVCEVLQEANCACGYNDMSSELVTDFSCTRINASNDCKTTAPISKCLPCRSLWKAKTCDPRNCSFLCRCRCKGGKSARIIDCAKWCNGMKDCPSNDDEELEEKCEQIDHEYEIVHHMILGGIACIFLGLLSVWVCASSSVRNFFFSIYQTIRGKIRKLQGTPDEQAEQEHNDGATLGGRSQTEASISYSQFSMIESFNVTTVGGASTTHHSSNSIANANSEVGMDTVNETKQEHEEVKYVPTCSPPSYEDACGASINAT